MTSYDNFAKTFSASRVNMKWEELDYITDYINKNMDLENPSFLDVGCGNGRLLNYLKSPGSLNHPLNEGGHLFVNNKFYYLGTDLCEGLIEEAKKLNPENDFLVVDMKNIDEISYKRKFDVIFLIASFHHLNNIEDREYVLNKLKTLLNPNGIIFMTNWALNSELNQKKYNSSIIPDSQNSFGSLDYDIKIGEFSRYYHCFSLEELDYLFKKTGFDVVENRLFDNKRNFVSIIKAPH